MEKTSLEYFEDQMNCEMSPNAKSLQTLKKNAVDPLEQSEIPILRWHSRALQDASDVVKEFYRPLNSDL